MLDRFITGVSYVVLSHYRNFTTIAKWCQVLYASDSLLFPAMSLTAVFSVNSTAAQKYGDKIKK